MIIQGGREAGHVIKYHSNFDYLVRVFGISYSRRKEKSLESAMEHFGNLCIAHLLDTSQLS
jgi:hypothetical protein